MSRMNRRRFTWVATSGIASAALVACTGEAVDEDLTPTRIPDVAGAPPTLAPNATPFDSEAVAGGEEQAAGGEQAGGGGPITVQALDALAFDPSEFTIPADTEVEIHVVNAGQLQHDFIIEETDFGTELLNGGEEATLTISLPEGEYVYFCSVPGHREGGMEGTLTVSADAPAAGAEQEVATPEDEATPAEEAAAGEEAAAAEQVTVEALDALAFDPSEFTIPADTEVAIHVVNAGVLQHDFVIEETDFATELLDGGEEATLTVSLPAGEYVYFCSVPGHREAGMEGTLTVE